MTLFTFASTYCMPKQPSTGPTHRRKDVIVIVRPYCHSDRDAFTYEQYCRQQLMLHVSFQTDIKLIRRTQHLCKVHATYLLSTGAPSNSLQDDIRRLGEQHTHSDDRNIISIKC